jgi:hypothetical protein
MKVLTLILCSIFIIQIVEADTGKQRELDRYQKFLRKKASEGSTTFRFNRYERIIAGGVALVTGTVGFFSTENRVLSYAYSGVQTIGIISVGEGIYDLHKVNFEKEIVDVNLPSKKITTNNLKNYFSYKYINYKAKEDYAFRVSLLATTSLLSLQYFSNALFKGEKSTNDLEKVYLFLGGVNLVIAAHSYFYRSDFERFMSTKVRKKKISISPLINFGSGSTVGILGYMSF